MKITTFIISFILLLITAISFITDITNFNEFGDYIYKSIQIILMMICVIGIALNWPRLLLYKRSFRSITFTLSV